MAQSVRLTTITMIAALLAAGPAVAQKPLANGSVLGTVSLGCAVDYSNPRETRMIVTNSSGRAVVAGSMLRWTTNSSDGRLHLPRAIPAGDIFSFGLNAKGRNCSVRATPPEPMLSQ